MGLLDDLEKLVNRLATDMTDEDNEQCSVVKTELLRRWIKHKRDNESDPLEDVDTFITEEHIKRRDDYIYYNTLKAKVTNMRGIGSKKNKE